MTKTERRWWHDRTVYQVYPRSFNDSNGDGIGDIPGIIEKLDYLKELGIGIIWLSPVFTSPMDDNGYDIADYRDIAPEFGTLADFERLIAEADKRDIKIISDLVVNHTSDEHDWFVQSYSDRNSRYRDFYIWRDAGPDGGPPNDMQSIFGGPAWHWHEEAGQYYYHHFSKRQPDLNWRNPELRAEVHDMMNWWLDKGIAGFRMDVIDMIGKDIDEGITTDGPYLHEYLKEMATAANLAGRDALTVGEAWSATPGSALLYSGRERGELSMVFQFEYVIDQWDEVHSKWKPKQINLPKLKATLNKWQYALADDGWNSLFWGNHDLPRALSRYGDTENYHAESAKMLATVMNLMKGTPYVYQGEEIGMSNVPFTAIDQYRDIETLNYYKLHVEAGESPEDFLAAANAVSRDNARTPMQWSAAPHGGFTSGAPWIEAHPNHQTVNAEAAMTADGSIWQHYQKLIGLRKSHDVLVYGRYQSHFDHHDQAFVYERVLGDVRVLVMANFRAEPLELILPKELQVSGECLISNYAPQDTLGRKVSLAPYEAFALKVN